MSTAKIADSAVTTAKINDLAVTTGKINGSAVDYTKVAAGAAVQVVYNMTGAVATGTTTIPSDDTIPQNTEGTQFMTQAITPKATTHILVIEVTANLASTAGPIDTIGALFQDTTANALAAVKLRQSASSDMNTMVIRHVMVAGTTSATTFKFRAGPSSAATVSFNGEAGSRLFGGVSASSMVIREYKA